ncbi:MAG TPA: hypothetical protein VFS41_01005 [Edaphobacter sp.]|nr:hypothetical protein [Edaphobacter sp.]
MKINEKKNTPAVGPSVLSAKDEQGKEWWRMVHADRRTSVWVLDRAVLHKWIRDQGYTRFVEDGDLKLFPEDPSSPAGEQETSL